MMKLKTAMRATTQMLPRKSPLIRRLVVALALGSALVHTVRVWGAAPDCDNPPPVYGSGGIMDNPEVASTVRELPEIIERDRHRGQLVSISIAVVFDQQTIFAAGFGCAAIERRLPATPDTVYRIGSVTKVFEATALMQQRDAEKLQLDDQVDQLVPEVWYRDPSGQKYSPTWKQLASHTGGLPDAMRPGLRTVPRLFNFLHGVRALYEPGSRYSYSDIGFVALGQSVARVAGENYHEYIRRHIFEPLGMTSSTYAVETVDRNLLAVGYKRGARGGLVPAGYANPFPPSGTILSTANDMARFIMLHFRDRPAGGDQILAASSIREMWQPIAPLPKGGENAVGIGWFLHPFDGYHLVNKDGGQAGFTTLLDMIPEHKLGVICFINESPPLQARDHAGTVVIMRLVLQHLLPVITRANG
jgi:CubicO group peptidase (beta-lactamase class C family)